MSVFHYIPLHTSPFGSKNGIAKSKMDNTEATSQTLLRLPIYYKIKGKDVQIVCKTISKFFNN